MGLNGPYTHSSPQNPIAVSGGGGAPRKGEKKGREGKEGTNKEKREGMVEEGKGEEVRGREGEGKGGKEKGRGRRTSAASNFSEALCGLVFMK